MKSKANDWDATLELMKATDQFKKCIENDDYKNTLVIITKDTWRLIQSIELEKEITRKTDNCTPRTIQLTVTVEIKDNGKSHVTSSDIKLYNAPF